MTKTQKYKNSKTQKLKNSKTQKLKLPTKKVQSSIKSLSSEAQRAEQQRHYLFHRFPVSGYIIPTMRHYCSITHNYHYNVVTFR